MKKLMIISFLTLMIGCSKNVLDNPGFSANSSNLITFDQANFSFDYPKKLTYKFSRDDGSVLLATNSGSSFIDGPLDYYLTIQSLSNKCSPSITGSNEKRNAMNSDGIIWGRLDALQASADPPYPNALCKIPTNGCTKEQLWSGSGCQIGHAAYALCAEKGEKTVVVCISQMTDNPALAKQIFDSFRWIDSPAQ